MYPALSEICPQQHNISSTYSLDSRESQALPSTFRLAEREYNTIACLVIIAHRMSRLWFYEILCWEVQDFLDISCIVNELIDEDIEEQEARRLFLNKFD
jgi:hypothetical protein